MTLYMKINAISPSPPSLGCSLNVKGIKECLLKHIVPWILGQTSFSALVGIACHPYDVLKPVPAKVSCVLCARSLRYMSCSGPGVGATASVVVPAQPVSDLSSEVIGRMVLVPGVLLKKEFSRGARV